MAEVDDKVYTDDELLEQLNDEFRSAVMPVTVFVGIEVFIGFFGNLLVIYVFLFRYHVCNFRYFVLCMAFVDFLSTITTMPGELVTQLYWYVYPYRLLCKIKSFFNVFTVSSEALCLLLIAFDRFRKVCYPLGWQIRPKIAIFLCGLVYAFAFIISLPVAFFWGVHHQNTTYKNMTLVATICEKDEEYNNTNYPLQYSSSIQGIISISLILMFGLYVFVARKLVMGKHRLCGNKIKVISAPSSSSHPGASSDVGAKQEYEMSSKQDTSDAGYSSGLDNKPAKSKYNYISSDGGLTTDEEDSTTRNTLSIPGLQSASRKNTAKKTQSKTSTTRVKKNVGRRVRRKTKIMIILTVSFIITTIMYLTLLSFIADNILEGLGDVQKAVYFFFFRLYFINHVMNPILYGFLDPHFKKVMKQFKHKICGKK